MFRCRSDVYYIHSVVFDGAWGESLAGFGSNDVWSYRRR